MDLNTIVHHRRLYDWLGGFDETLPRLQDWDLALRYTSVFLPVFVNRIGVFYRRNIAWGQVTHLFKASNAHNTVSEKARVRQDHGPDRLAIIWPARGRVTVLRNDEFQSRVMAASLAQMIGTYADVDLLTLNNLRDAALNGGPVLMVGLSKEDIGVVPRLDLSQSYRLVTTDTGSSLESLCDPAIRFDLGALPLELPKISDTGARRLVLVLPPANMDAELLAQLREQAKRQGLTLLFRPKDVLSDALGRVAVTLCLCPVGNLSPFDLALVNALQARGVPAAVLPETADDPADGLARQWIEAKAAYEIKVNTPGWICEKLRKLMASGDAMSRLQDRSRKVHRIALSPRG